MSVGFPPGQPQFFELHVFLLVSIYSEDEREIYLIDLAVKTPSGDEGHVGSVELGFIDGRFISTIATPLSIEMDEPGTFWIKAYHRRRLLGELPLKIDFFAMAIENEVVH